MKLLSKRNLIGGLLVLMSMSALAQPWFEISGEGEEPDFYQVQAAFENYWSEYGDSIPGGRGWKGFKRWEWFWEPRVFPEGQFPKIGQLHAAKEDYLKQGLEKNSRSIPMPAI